MKTLLTILILPGYLYAQNVTIYTTAGATSPVKEFTPGYFVGIGTHNPLRDKVDIDVELTFLRYESSSAQESNLNFTFFYKYQPFANLNFRILAGAGAGYIPVSTDGEVRQGYGSHLSALGGLSYKIRRFEILTKYNYVLNGGRTFDQTIQLGASYDFKR